MSKYETSPIPRRAALGLLGAAGVVGLDIALSGCGWGSPTPRPSLEVTHPDKVALLPEPMRKHIRAARTIDQTTGDYRKSALWRSGVSLSDGSVYGSGSIVKSPEGEYQLLTISHVADALDPTNTAVYVPAVETVAMLEPGGFVPIPTPAIDGPRVYNFGQTGHDFLSQVEEEGLLTPLELGFEHAYEGMPVFSSDLQRGGFERYTVMGNTLAESDSAGGWMLLGGVDQTCHGESGTAILRSDTLGGEPTNKVQGVVSSIMVFDPSASCGTVVFTSPIR